MPRPMPARGTPTLRRAGTQAVTSARTRRALASRASTSLHALRTSTCLTCTSGASWRPVSTRQRRPKTLMELWTAIKAAWDEDLTEAKLECAYRLLDPVMGLIAAHNGYNNFKLPHSGIREQMRADGWDI